VDHIAASIMSKKLAEGAEHLVLDVKVGRASFLPTMAEARPLAEILVAIARDGGRRARAVLTDMERPLGRSAGNGLEVLESIEALQGGGPPDLRELVLTLGAEAQVLVSGRDPTQDTLQRAALELSELLDNGAAWSTFRAMVEAQGGDAGRLDHAGLLRLAPTGEDGGAAPLEWVLEAAHGGYLAELDALRIGWASCAVGAGRGPHGGAPLAGVGVRWRVVPGQRVERGEELARLYHGGDGLEEAAEHLRRAFVIGPEPVKPQARILDAL
jgi:pyrimidine-nucleoside phosphorylase/thymidine phosphorylase